MSSTGQRKHTSSRQSRLSAGTGACVSRALLTAMSYQPRRIDLQTCNQSCIDMEGPVIASCASGCASFEFPLPRRRKMGGGPVRTSSRDPPYRTSPRAHAVHDGDSPPGNPPGERTLQRPAHCTYSKLVHTRLFI